MTARKPTPSKRGRKSKPEGEKLAQLTIRMPDENMALLRDLSDLRGESLSQSMLWCLITASKSVSASQWAALEAVRYARKGVK